MRLIDSMPPARTIRLADQDGLRAERDGLESRGARLIDGLGGNFVGEAGAAADLARRDWARSRPDARDR